MSLLKKIKASLRTAVVANRSCPGWERDIAMIYCRESDLAKGAKIGFLPQGTLEYATEVIELKIQGKTVAKTRQQWAQFKNNQSPLPSFPYRSYDSEMTKGKIIHQALLDLVSLNKAYPELSIDELNDLISKKFWHKLPDSRSWDYSKLLEESKQEESKEDKPTNKPQPPRLHHYQFAYRALPGLAFADAHVPLGFGHDTPKDSLPEFWKYVGTKFPEDERVSDSGLSALDTHFGPDYVILLVTMPTPLRDTEAYFAAIIYPKSWFNDSTQENSEPDLRCFILAKSEVPGVGGMPGGTLRTLTRTGHGAVKFGVPISVEAFLEEVQKALLNPHKWITWVDSEPWNFSMQDEEMKPILRGIVRDVSALETNKEQKKLRIIVLDGDPSFLEFYEILIRNVYKDSNVLKFDNGDEALQELLRTDPDLLITDIHHTGLPSREMLAFLGRQRVIFPILVATGDRTAKEALQCEEFDLKVSYLSKPFDPEIVVEWLKTGLKIAHKR